MKTPRIVWAAALALPLLLATTGCGKKETSAGAAAPAPGTEQAAAPEPQPAPAPEAPPTAPPPATAATMEVVDKASQAKDYEAAVAGVMALYQQQQASSDVMNRDRALQAQIARDLASPDPRVRANAERAAAMMRAMGRPPGAR